MIYDRHLERCKIKNVPALQIEEALISRFKDLSSDRDLVADLVKSTRLGKRESLKYEKSVIAAKEQERSKLGVPREQQCRRYFRKKHSVPSPSLLRVKF